MSPHQRVLIRHRLPSHNPAAASAIFGLLESRVHSLEPMQPLLESWRQAVVCLNLVDESGVTANLRGV